MHQTNSKKKKAIKQSKSAQTDSINIAVTGNGYKANTLLTLLNDDPRYQKIISIDPYPPRGKLDRVKHFTFEFISNTADQDLARILEEENIDTLVHTALPITPPTKESFAHELISVGTMYVCNAASSVKLKKLILTSSTDLYGPFANNPNYLTEKHPIRAGRKSRFLKDKCDAEKQIIQFSKKNPDTTVTILRPCTIVGPTIKSFKTDYYNLPVIPTILGYDPLMQYIHEEDFKRGLLLTLEKNCPGIYNLVGQGVLPLSKVIQMTGRLSIPMSLIGLKFIVQSLWYFHLLPAPASYIDYLKYLCVASGDKAEKKLGFLAKYTSKEAFQSFVSAERLRRVHLVEG